MPPQKNKLYFGDNLDIMREFIGDETVDLIYLDPPFNSKATYNVLYSERNGTKSAAQITAFEDIWNLLMNPNDEVCEVSANYLSHLHGYPMSFQAQTGTQGVSSVPLVCS